MNSIFDELFSTEGIQGVLLYTSEGEPAFSRFAPPLSGEMDVGQAVSLLSGAIDWTLFSEVFKTADEAEMIFENRRIYIKKIRTGYLFVIMGHFIPTAMVRLNCEIIVPELEKAKKQRGLARFFGL